MPHAETTHTRTHRPRGAVRAALALAIVGAGMALGACRGDRTDAPPRRFFPDMDHQPKIKAQSESEFFVDGTGQRPVVDGTVPFGSTTHTRDQLERVSWGEKYLRERKSIRKDDHTFATGLAGGSGDEYAATMPVPVTRELIERGRERFDIYCSMCHGYDGVGGDSGTVGRLWSVPPANLSRDEKYIDRSVQTGKDGYLFHIIRNGLYTPDGSIRMPSYKHAIDELDAWAIVAYLRVLQEAHNADPSAIDASTLGALGERPAPEPEPGADDAMDGGAG